MTLVGHVNMDSSSVIASHPGVGMVSRNTPAGHCADSTKAVNQKLRTGSCEIACTGSSSAVREKHVEYTRGRELICGKFFLT